MASKIMYIIEKPQESFDEAHMLSASTYFPCISCLDDTILPPQRKLPESMATKLSRTARYLSIVTLAFTLALTGFAFFISNESESSATFGFALDTFFAMVSSCMLIWRFSSTNLDSFTIAKRETHATYIVAISMVVSSIAVFVRAILCLYYIDKPQKPMELLILTTASLTIYLILFTLKYIVAQKLGSGCLMTDAIDSLFGAIFSISILISALILKYTMKVWYLDSSIAILVSVFSFVYGLVVIEKLIRMFKKREDKARHESELAYERLESESNELNNGQCSFLDAQ